MAYARQARLKTHRFCRNAVYAPVLRRVSSSEPYERRYFYANTFLRRFFGTVYEKKTGRNKKIDIFLKAFFPAIDYTRVCEVVFVLHRNTCGKIKIEIFQSICVTRRRTSLLNSERHRQRHELFPITTELAYDICFHNIHIHFRDLTTRIARSQSKYSDRTTEYFLSAFVSLNSAFSLSRSTCNIFHFLVPNISVSHFFPIPFIIYFNRTPFIFARTSRYPGSFKKCIQKKMHVYSNRSEQPFTVLKWAFYFRLIAHAVRLQINFTNSYRTNLYKSFNISSVIATMQKNKKNQ